MIISKCCREDVKIESMHCEAYYVCSKCSLPAQTMVSFDLGAFDKESQSADV